MQERLETAGSSTGILNVSKIIGALVFLSFGLLLLFIYFLN